MTPVDFMTYVDFSPWHFLLWFKPSAVHRISIGDHINVYGKTQRMIDFYNYNKLYKWKI